MNDDNTSGAVTVRVGVLFGGAAMGGPSGVSDPVGAVERLQPDNLFQVPELAFSTADLQAFSVTADRNPRRIVAPILELPESLNDYRDDSFLAYIADNPAHCALLNNLVLKTEQGYFRNHGG